jgi:hypothetical protein
MKERLARLDAAIAEGRIIHGAWRRVDDNGRELVCLLAALSPEAARRGDPDACPAEVMPAWLARLTPSVDYGVSSKYRPELIRRYAGLAHRWHVLDADGWLRCNLRVRRAALVEAMAHTADEHVLGLCDRVLGLLDRELAGDSVSYAEWRLMSVAVVAATREAERAAERESARVAERAAVRVAGVAERAAGGAARMAEGAAYAAAAVDSWVAAWDRMAAAILDAIEFEIERAEA